MTQFDDIYASLQRSLGPAFAGELDLAEQYAAATCLAAAQAQIDLAAAQDDPTTVTYLVDDLCKDFKVYPPSGSTLEQKRVLLAAAMSYANGCALATVRAGLLAILGDGYIHARPMSGTEIVSYPATPIPLLPATTPFKLIEFDEIIWPGLRTVAYSRLLDDGNQVTTGEQLTIAIGKPGIEETVTVVSAGGTPESPTLTATFARAHEVGENGITGPHSNWLGNARHWLISVEESVLTNAPLLASANEYLKKTLTSASTWVFCRASTGDIYSFAVGSLVGYDVIGNLTVEV